MWSFTWQKQKIIVFQKFAVLTDVAAMIAPTIAMLLVAVTIAVPTISKTVVNKLWLNMTNGFLRNLLRGYQHNNL